VASAQDKKDKQDDKAAKLELAITDFAKVAKSLGVKPLTAEQKKAAEPLQGTWTVSKMVVNGKQLTDAELKGRTVVIKGQVFAVVVDNELKVGGLPFLNGIDPTKNPKELDLDLIVDDHARPTLQGIYSLEGKTLTIALELGEGKRPTGFDT